VHSIGIVALQPTVRTGENAISERLNPKKYAAKIKLEHGVDDALREALTDGRNGRAIVSAM
jgi:hypothetical protein